MLDWTHPLKAVSSVIQTWNLQPLMCATDAVVLISIEEVRSEYKHQRTRFLLSFKLESLLRIVSGELSGLTCLC